MKEYHLYLLKSIFYISWNVLKEIFYRYAFEDLVIKKEKFHDSLTHEQLSKFAKVILSNGEKYDVEMYLVECEDEEGD